MSFRAGPTVNARLRGHDVRRVVAFETLPASRDSGASAADSAMLLRSIPPLRAHSAKSLFSQRFILTAFHITWLT